MKILVSLLAFINGSYMLLDGIYVIIQGKYIGPDRPGPWANLFYKLNINVFKLGPMFILFGMGWLLFLAALWSNQSWAYTLGILLSVFTFWYLPFGTLLSIIILSILLTSKQKLGI